MPDNPTMTTSASQHPLGELLTALASDKRFCAYLAPALQSLIEGHCANSASTELPEAVLTTLVRFLPMLETDGASASFTHSIKSSLYTLRYKIELLSVLVDGLVEHISCTDLTISGIRWFVYDLQDHCATLDACIPDQQG